MPEPIALLILAFATYRFGSLLAWESGPYEILLKIRYAIGVRYDELNKPYGGNEVAKMILCLYCNTVWIALVLVILYSMFGTIVLALCLPFAISAGAIAIHELTD